MAFTTWSDLYDQFRDALQSMPAEQLVKSGWTTPNGQQAHTFRNLSELEKYEKFLKRKADEEKIGVRKRSIFRGGYGERS